MHIGFVGAGKVATAFGRYLHNHDVHISGCFDRHPKKVAHAGQATGGLEFTNIDEVADGSDMIHHTKAVARGTEKALLIGDMPFLPYRVSTEEAVRNAGRFIQEGGAQAVKLEGGAKIIDKIRAIINAQIPVLGHLGLTPQSVNAMGGFKLQGKDLDTARQIDEKILAKI